jgi:hemoglobin
MRHVDFRIDGVARDRWLTHMSDAMSEMGMQPAAEVELWKYFVGAAFAMQNVPDDLPTGSIAVGETEDPRRADDPA